MVLIADAAGSGSVIMQNKIIQGPSSTFDASVDISISASNIMISNNVIIHERSPSFHAIRGGSQLLIYNNVIESLYGWAITGSTGCDIVNNIFKYGLYTAAPGVFRYNMFWASDPGGTGNLENVDMNTVFVDPSNYDYHLAPGSPAISAGEYGTDMGIYGGDAPYVDGGFPGLPSILQIFAPTVGSQQSGLDIQFNAKSNKE